MNITLSQEQIQEIIVNDDQAKYSIFRDTCGTLSVTETDNFPDKLRFYMKRSDKSAKDVATFFRNTYPTLLSSSSSIHHYIRGIRTPKLSVLMGLAECLNIAPALLLPGVAGSYIVKQANHVEMTRKPIQVKAPAEVQEVLLVEPNEDNDYVQDLLLEDVGDELTVDSEEIIKSTEEPVLCLTEGVSDVTDTETEEETVEEAFEEVHEERDSSETSAEEEGLELSKVLEVPEEEQLIIETTKLELDVQEDFDSFDSFFATKDSSSSFGSV